MGNAGAAEIIFNFNSSDYGTRFSVFTDRIGKDSSALPNLKVWNRKSVQTDVS